LRESDGQIVGHCVYATELFEAATVTRLLDHWQRVLSQMVDKAGLPVSDLQLMSEAELQRVVLDWTTIQKRYPVENCIHELFELQVKNAPDSPALICGDESWTYRELDRKANQLAHYLRTLGVGPEGRVGIFVERGFETVLGMLGILKAGGAYVPLDPDYPSERLAFLLRDSQAEVVLTQERLAHRLLDVNAQVVTLDGGWSTIALQSADRLPALAGPENAAYIIYTSGSTGQPKGVAVTHSNVIRLLEATKIQFHFGSADVWTLFHSCAFDFSVWEIWGALCFGGKLVIVSYLESRSPDAFYEVLSRQKVTVLNQTPSAFRLLMQADDSRPLPLVLRCVIFGGEALNPAALAP